MASMRMVASDQLLQRVIITQNGDMMMGIRELTQNAFDSYHGTGTEKPVIEFKLSDKDSITGFYKTLSCRDYGKTLGATEDEVFNNFFIFGASRKGCDEIGEFGIGRGQTMAIIYNPDTMQLEGEHVVRSGKFIIKNVDIATLTADVIESDYPIDGTEWTIKSLVPKFNKEDITNFFRRKYAGAIPIYLDEEPISASSARKSNEDETFFSIPAADVWIDITKDYGGTFDIYDRGFYVTYRHIVRGWGGRVVSKDALKLNFARNEIFDTETWRQITDFIRRKVLEIAINNIEADWGRDKKEGLAEVWVKNPDDRAALNNNPIVELANGKWISPATLFSHNELYIAPKGSVVAIEGIARGYAVVNDDSPFAAHITSTVKSITNFADCELGKEILMNRFVRANPSQKEKSALDLLNSIFSGHKELNREILVGEYPNENMEAWTIPDSREIYINRSTLRVWLRGSLERVPLRAIECLVHEYSHSSSDVKDDDHGYSFDTKQVKMMATILKVYDEWLDQRHWPKLLPRHTQMMLEVMKDKLGIDDPDRNWLKSTDILTDEILETIIMEGGDPEAAFNTLLSVLAEYKFLDERRFDSDQDIVISRKDLLFK